MVVDVPDIVQLTPERVEDAPATERVIDRAFGPGRFAKVSERVRERIVTPCPDLSRVAWRSGRIVGCCRIYGGRIGAAPVRFLGPLAVDPEERGEGLGRALVTATIEACRAEGLAQAVILVGAPGFFAPLGFTQIPSGQVTLPGPVEPRRLQWLLLAAGETPVGALAPL